MRNVGLAKGRNVGGTGEEVTRPLVVSASDAGVVAGVDVRTGEVGAFIYFTLSLEGQVAK